MINTANDTTGPSGEVWSGAWVRERLGVELVGDEELTGLLGLALRRNPKRAHLLVSNVLGKHVPQSPAVVYGHGFALGGRVRELLGEDGARAAVVLGYAETATGLGHSVADGVGEAPYLHSTRRPVEGVAQAGGFEESHSHATSHLLLPEDPALLAGPGPLVLVDDEFSTGNTVLNTIRALHERYPRERYVVVALVDMRSTADQGRLAAFAREIGARVDLVTAAKGTVRLPEGVLEKGQALVAEHEGGAGAAPGRAAGCTHPGVTRVELGWPAGVPDGGRHGFTPAHRARLESALPAMAARLAEALPPGARRVLVLGFEELMYAPLALARELERSVAPDGPEIRFSTTTRSPVLAVDDPGYAIRSRIVFPAHDDPADGPGERYAYNVAGSAFDAVITVVDSAADTPALHAPDGLLTTLAAHTPNVLLAVVPAYVPAPPPPHRPERSSMLPEPLRGPGFSSYAADEVGWLLQDLSDVTLEAPTEEREEAIQSGGAHYAESLPVEYQPSEQYQALFHSALDASAERIAAAVGVVTESVLAERSARPVLVSLARAGTPVGVLMRRWARHRHGIDVPHYAVSIVRGRGIDANALRWLAAHHDPADVVFVDGWTGKGAITRELAAAIEEFEASDGIAGFDPEIAVLADPGSCVRTYGTREDFLIPSACLNSTVSGLISRTVLRADLVGPDDYHGAKFYRELAGVDVSVAFLDAVSERFDDVVDTVDSRTKELLTADRTPTWVGWAAVERISEEYGIHDVNLVKPGVGETTRVLLRRVPWKILARAGAGADLDHVRLLAEQRGVPVEEVAELPYTCVGLIHPKYTRGATGADGKAVAL
ncbi:phosphoribosyltransferase [Streptomyces caniscabiei]|uniref:Phosphoribosyltransferase n=1 Tax=Streptomyces caniscabiei TaxID=2746961 RepID=A0ABU4MPZ2_9ACTN|nr:phosphoribosyltransferase [Streptomyces caniscabiei]MBE4737944.1 phosphoribosyltransferase domain-containing protein [Streptomyces caniscabiei]MBE4757257.1 phosphoribosyltransferase domain-containing protein [Streptomyces caniscabiei]MBE4769256.1 phosphoribosyltransferase domain-containing protein [Streptomyces caniscabiei]MBE4785023.1 phosphoribosyltransferase domain-containing protein [Streptomyces caniscabiei]MBE4795807.1 phosphoribosyltransferase domain-containing protein [Streptomyces 